MTADVRAWHAAKGSDLKAAGPKPRRRLGDALDMEKLRANIGTNILFKLDADSADSKTMDKLAAKVAAAIEDPVPVDVVRRHAQKRRRRQRRLCSRRLLRLRRRRLDATHDAQGGCP